MSGFKTIQTVSGQTLVDIAIQEYGDYESVFTLISDNAVVNSLDQVFTPGTKIKIRIGEGNINSNYFELQERKMNSGFTPPDEDSDEYIDVDYFEPDYI